MILRSAIAVIVMVWGLGWAITSAAHAETRLALVIGNADYKHTTKLDNPISDVRIVGMALKQQGFDVTAEVDADRRAMRRALQAFFAKVQRAGRDAVVVVYYAGHGVQARGRNFMIPVDAEIDSEDGVEDDAISTDSLMQMVANAGTRLNIVILDACRNNPFRGFRAATRGLAQIEAPTGTLVAFSTAPGRVARDGPKGGNSPYAAALVQAVVEPGLKIEDVFKRVRQAVSGQTRGEQVPWESSSLVGDFYPAGKAGVGQVVAKAAKEVSESLTGDAERAWGLIKDSTSIAAFEAFVRRFRDTFYGDLAQQRLDELKRLAALQIRPPVGRVEPARPDMAVVAPGVVGPQPAASTRAADPALGVAPGSGKSFRDCADCPEMVVAPAGSFTMGSPASEPERSSDEAQVLVTIAKPFAVGRFAVAFDEWTACVTDGGCNSHIPSDQGWGRGKRPVINVSWNDAKAYAAWLSTKTGKSYRLLSEAEREYVTRAGSTSPFWWGSAITPAQANYDGSATPYKEGGSRGEYRQRTVPVDSFQPSPWGLHNVHGNVWEWTEDCWNDTNIGNPGNGNLRSVGDCGRRVVRGGSWYSGPRRLRAAFRDWYATFNRYSDLSFRVARTLP